MLVCCVEGGISVITPCIEKITQSTNIPVRESDQAKK